MCAYPRFIINPRYRNLNNQELYKDFHDYKVLIPCGKCPDCLKRRRNDWRVRMIKECELGAHRFVYFITLTFDDPSLARFEKSPEKAIRLFLERYRKETGKSLRHFITAEYGTDDDGTHRLHFHGLIFDPKVGIKTFTRLWSYGRTDVSRMRHNGAVLYVTKYIMKPPGHDGPFCGRIWVSPGFGRCYLTHKSARVHRNSDHNASFIHFGPFMYALPRYYKQKLFSESELKQLAARYQLRKIAQMSIKTERDKYFQKLDYQRFVYSNPWPPDPIRKYIILLDNASDFRSA